MNAETGSANSRGSDAILSVLTNVLRPIAAIITIPILAHELGVEGRGSLAAVTAPILLVVAAGGFGLPEVAIFHLARQETDRNRLYRRLRIASLAPGLACMTALILMSHWLAGSNDSLQLRIACGAAVIPLAIWVSVLRAAAISVGNWKAVRREQLIVSVLTVVGISGLAVTNYLTLDSAIAVTLGTQVVGGLAYRAQRLPDSGGTAHPSMPTLWSYAARSWAGAAAGVALTRLDQSLMVGLAGTAELGIYAVAVSVGEVPLLVSAVITTMAFSADSASRSDDRLGTMARVTTASCLLMAATIAVASPLVYEFLFPEGFERAALPTVIVVFSVALGIPGSVAGAAISGRGRPGLRSAGLLVASALNVAAVFMLVPDHGATGAALATAVGTLAAASWMLVALRTSFRVRLAPFFGFRRSDARLVVSTVRQLLRK